MSFTIRLLTILSVAFASFGVNAGELRKSHVRTHPAYIVDGPVTLAPLAFLKFCLHYAAECHPQQNPENSVKLTPEVFATLSAVNGQINRKIAPDPAKGAIDWSLDTRKGNCNDYAVQKRSALAASGLPLAALSLVTVLTYSGEGHLVLSVRTDQGDFILDNLHENVVPVSGVNYTWLKRQSADPMKWVSIDTVAT